MALSLDPQRTHPPLLVPTVGSCSPLCNKQQLSARPSVRLLGAAAERWGLQEAATL